MEIYCNFSVGFLCLSVSASKLLKLHSSVNTCDTIIYLSTKALYQLARRCRVSRQPILTNYTSEIDQFFHEFDKQHPEASKSQKKEQAKYCRIYQLRDTTERLDDNKKLWDGF
jgi:hypothetical protein